MLSFLPADTGALRTRPWARRETGGIYVGYDKSVWLYRQLPLLPLQHEDPDRRLTAGADIEALLEEIGALSRDVGQGLRSLAVTRSVHLFAVTFGTANRPPDAASERLAEFLDEMLDPVGTAKALLIGVRLRSALLAPAGAPKRKGGVLSTVREMLTTDETDLTLDAFAADAAEIEAIMRRGGATVPTADARDQLESWWNLGRTTDHVVEYTTDSFLVPGVGEYEIAAVDAFPTSLRAPFAQWALDAMAHQQPAVAISVRAELEPPTITRTRLRRQRRKLIAQEEEEAATGDLGRDENASALRTAQDIERHVVNTQQPWLTDTSVLMAQRLTGADVTYRDYLAATYEIVARPLEHRQLEALAEMQPAAATRVNPFPQDLNLAMIAYAGFSSFSAMGESSGALLGHVDPDFTPCYVELLAAARQNKPPVLGLFGDPGSGKTFAAQLLTGQAVLDGAAAFFINPKAADSLSPWADWVRSRGGTARTVALSKVTQDGPGAFDPFSFCPDPQMAAEVLHRHILAFLGYAMLPTQQIALASDLTRAVAAGVECSMDALAFISDPQVSSMVRGAVESFPMFALAFADRKRDDWDADGLTLLEFDRDLGLPPPGKVNLDLTERLAVATLRLTGRAALEILIRRGGGVFVIDEAHHYLGSDEGRSTMDRLAREGRSMGLLPVFVTQRPADLLAADMETFMSRVLCMQLNDQAQARAALQLCRLEPTAERIDFLRSCGPRPGGEGVPGRPAMGFLRDLNDRHAVITVGPVPEELRLAMSTNRTDRELREAQASSPRSEVGQ